MISVLSLCFVITVSTATMLLPRPNLIVNPKTQPTLPLLREVFDDSTNLPRAKDLNNNKLLRRLESEFDSRWMSVDAPVRGEASEMESNPVNSETPAWLLTELTKLNLTRTPNNVAAVPESRSALEVWLLERASCPVRYSWEDIGPLFWPPWVKHGKCVDRQCSWPSGMNCVPGETNTITLLRWFCMPASPEVEEDEKSNRKRKNCRWLKVPYPIMSECVCKCK